MARGGIYLIRNLKTGDLYVGSTKSFYYRFWKHCYGLQNHCHFNYKLQKASHDYGFRNLQFEILEVVDSAELLFPKEQAWMNELKPIYNIRKRAGWFPKRRKRRQRKK